MRVKTFKGTVLVVSGNDQFMKSLSDVLARGGYSVRQARNQQDGLAELRSLIPTIVVVDRTESGFARLRHAIPDHTPIVTASNHPGFCDEHHCVLDIEDGATRAVCNAGPLVILALVNAVLRRQRWQQPAPDRFTAEDLSIDFTNYEFRVGARPVSITPTQFRILRSLAAAPGHFLSRQALRDQVWGEGFAICPHTLDVNLSSLRRTLRASGTSPDLIMTIKGVGFKLRSSMASESVVSRSQAASSVGDPLSSTRRSPAVFRYTPVAWRSRLMRRYHSSSPTSATKDALPSRAIRPVSVAESSTGSVTT